MSFCFRNLILVLALLPAGCHSLTNTSQLLRPALQDIESVDVDPDHHPSYLEYHLQVDQQIEQLLRRVPSAVALKNLFIECARRLQASPEQPQEHLIWIDPHDQAKHAVLSRLAELDSEVATRILVELYADETLRWDGELALNGANAISRCGRRALPHLTSIDFGFRKPVIQEIIACIEKGERYGP